MSAPSGRLPDLLKAGKSDQEIIRDVYRAAFSRQPTAAEEQTAASLIALAPTRKEGLEDFLWTVCNCKEFLFNH